MIEYIIFSHNLHDLFTIIGHDHADMKNEPAKKITVNLPDALYHRLRNEAHQQNLSLPEFIKKKVDLKPMKPTPLAKLPLKDLLAQTTPRFSHPDSRIDFFS